MILKKSIRLVGLFVGSFFAAGLCVAVAQQVQGGFNCIHGNLSELCRFGHALRDARPSVAYRQLPVQIVKGQPAPLSKKRKAAPADIALDFVRGQRQNLGLAAADLGDVIVKSEAESAHSGLRHVYLRQRIHGLEVECSNMSVNILPDGQVLQVGNRFSGGLAAMVNDPAPTLTAADALRIIAKHVKRKITAVQVVDAPQPDHAEQACTFGPCGVSEDPIPAKLIYCRGLATSPTPLRLCWNLVVRLDDGAHWLDVYVDADTGEILSQYNWICDMAQYEVFPEPLQDPNDGGRSIVVNPEDPVASPFGWHDTNGVVGAEFTDTQGNNVSAQDDTDADNAGGMRVDGGAALDFQTPLDLAQPPLTNLNAAIVNLFYWNNLLHDIHYHYGFDEASGNFQLNNYGNGGLGNDPVQADALDGSGNNNANFGTPPDGSAPRMQMFQWTQATPDRDSDFDNLIIVHEYGHGVSTRLTGGGANVNCLFGAQSGGMGEGWSDWWGLALTTKPTDTRLDNRTVGTYVLGQPLNGAGIRPNPYTTDLGVNPHTYESVNSGISVPHGVGSVWCVMLWEVYWDLVDEYGFDPDFHTGTGGNNLALQLVMDGLKLQPCEPTFVDARDGILLADQMNNGGANQELLWTAFAKRGLGLNAYPGVDHNDLNVTNSFEVPNFGMHVSASDPAKLDVEFTPPTSFTLTFYGGVDPVTLMASDLEVNGIPAAGVSLSASNIAVFTYAASPVTAQGTQTMFMATNAVTRLGDGAPLQEFNSCFLYDGLAIAVINMIPADGSLQQIPVTSLTFDFNELFNPATLDPADLILSEGSATAVTIVDGDTVTFTVTGITSEGVLTITIPAGALTDAFGNPNVAFSGTLLLDFGVVPLTVGDFTREVPNGGHIYRLRTSSLINPANDVDAWTFDVDVGNRITVVADPASGVGVNLSLTGPTGFVPQTGSGTAAGEPVVVQQALATVAGTYQVSVEGTGAGTGLMELLVYLNTAVENERYGGPVNNSAATAQSLDTGFRPMLDNASCNAVIGQLPSLLGAAFAGDDFESGTLGVSWATYSSNPGGRIQLFNSTEPGDYALFMDTTAGSNTLNEATFQVDLSGQAQVYLSFDHAEWGDETDDFTGPFTGHQDADGVALSVDGTQWYPIQNFANQPSGDWQPIVIDLTAAAASNSIALGATTFVRFQQFDNFDLTTDGRGFDNIAFLIPGGEVEDWYAVTLGAGEMLDAVITAPTGTGASLLDLIAPDGSTVLASGTPSLLWDNIVTGQVLAAAGPHYLRVSGPGEYDLWVVREGHIDVELNNSDATAQPIDLTGTVKGFLAEDSLVTPPIFAEVEPNDDGTNGGSIADIPFANDINGVLSPDPDGSGTLVAVVTGIVAQGNDDDWDFFRVDVAPGISLDIELFGSPSGLGSLGDPYLWLYDAAGNILDSNDDSNGLESRILFGPSAISQSVYVVADSYGGGAGSYTLVVGHSGTAPPLEEEDWFSINALAGSPLSVVTVTPSDGPFEFVNILDPQVTVYDPGGAVLASDDNSALDGHNAFLSIPSLPSTGRYLINVSAANAAEGEYVMHVDTQLVHTLTVTSPYGQANPATGTQVYPANTVLSPAVTNTIPIGVGTQLFASGWTGLGSVPANGTTNPVPAFMLSMNSEVHWLWSTQVLVTVTSTVGGTVSESGVAGVATGGWYALASTPLTLVPTAAPLYHFVGWTGDVPSGGATANPLTVPIDQARNLTAVFALDMADVQVSKTAPTSSVSGASLVYTMVVSNAGPDLASGVWLSDPLPGVFSSLVISNSIGSLAVGASTTITVTVTSSVSFAGLVTNTANIGSASVDPSATNNSSSATTLIYPLADLDIQMIAPATAIAGLPLSVSLVVSNTGPSDANGLLLSHVLPTGLTPVALPPLAITSLPLGASTTLTYTVGVDASTTGILSPVASVSAASLDPVLTNNTTSQSVVIVTQADVAVVKSGPAFAVPGASVSYSLLVTNAGPSDAASVTVSDLLPAGLSAISATAATFPLAAGASTTVVVSASIAAGLSGSITNTATVTSATTDLLISNNTSRVVTPLQPQSDVSIVLSAPVTGIAGTSYTVSAVISNAGPSVATGVAAALSGGSASASFPVASLAVGATTNVQLSIAVPSTFLGSILSSASVTSVSTDLLLANNSDTASTLISAIADLQLVASGPATVIAGLGYSVSVVISNAGPSDAAGGTVMANLSDGLQTVTVGPLAFGATTTQTFMVTTQPSDTGLLTNQLNLATSTLDPLLTNNADTVIVALSQEADLQLVASGPASVIAGQSYPVTVVISNAGPSDASGGTVAAALSDGLQSVTVGPLAFGATTTMTFTVTTQPSDIGLLTNQLAVATTTLDPLLTNNSDTVIVAIGQLADLQLVATGPASVIAGLSYPVTVVVSNAGPSDAAGGTLAATLSDGLQSVTVGPLAFGATTTMAFTVTTEASDAGLLTNQLNLATTTLDPLLTNNADTVVVAVGQQADLQIVATGPATVIAGLTYPITVVISNAGPSDAVGGTLAATLSDGLQSVTVGPLAFGAITAMTFTVTTQPSDAGLLTNQLNLIATTLDLVLANNSDMVLVAVGQQADLQLVASGPVSVIAGQSYPLSVVVSNAGPSDAAGGTIAANLSDGLQSVTVGPLAVGATTTLTFTVTTQASDVGLLSNPFTLSSTTLDLVSANNSDTVVVALGQEADLQLMASAPASVVAGLSYPLTVVISNAGPSDAAGGSLTAALSDGLQSVSVGPLALGASTTLTFNVSTLASGSGTLTNQLNLSAITPDPTPASSTVLVGLGALADLQLVATAPPSVIAGQSYPVSVVISNAGPSDAAGGSLAANLSDGLQTIAVGPLALGASTTLTFSVSTQPSDLGTLSNSFALSAITPDLTPASAAVTVAVLTEADLQLAVSGSSMALAGSSITMTVTVFNAGSSDAVGVVIAVENDGSLSPAGAGALSAGPLAIPAGTTSTVVLTSGVLPAAGGIATQVVSLISVTTDPTPAAPVSLLTPILPLADLELSLSGTASGVVGDTLSYTALVQNLGPGTAVAIDVVFSGGSGLLPLGVTTQQIASLAAGASTSLTFSATANNAGTLTATAQVSTVSADLVGANNLDTHSTAISGLDLAISLLGSSPVITPSFVYTVRVDNVSLSDASGLLITQDLSPDLTFLSAGSSPACTATINGVSCEIPSLLAGQTFDLLVQVQLATNAGSNLASIGTVSSVEPDVQALNNQVSLGLPVLDSDSDGIPNAYDPDNDNDLIPDAWELLYGLDPLDANDAPIDRDGDLQSNYAEYIADTDPMDGTAFLIITDLDAKIGDVFFPSKSSRVYTLQWTSDVVNGPWQDVAGQIGMPGLGGSMPMRHGVSGSHRFYRIVPALP